MKRDLRVFWRTWMSNALIFSCAGHHNVWFVVWRASLAIDGLMNFECFDILIFATTSPCVINYKQQHCKKDREVISEQELVWSHKVLSSMVLILLALIYIHFNTSNSKWFCWPGAPIQQNGADGCNSLLCKSPSQLPQISIIFHQLLTSYERDRKHLKPRQLPNWCWRAWSSSIPISFWSFWLVTHFSSFVRWRY